MGTEPSSFQQSDNHTVPIQSPDRLSIVLTSRAPFLGGAEVALLRMVKGLTEAGHQVCTIVGCKGEVSKRLKAEGHEYAICPMPQRSKAAVLKYQLSKSKLKKHLQRLRPDLVHSNDLPSHQITGAAAQSLNLPTMVYHRYNYDAEAISWMNKHAADHHLFVSQGLLDAMHPGFKALSKTPHAVVHDGLVLPEIDLSETGINQARKTARDELDLPLEKTIALFFGQMIQRKCIEELIDAWALLPKEKRESSALYIVGDDLANNGVFRYDMIDHAKQKSVTAVFPGFQKNIPTWITACDFVVAPSRFDPLGNAMLETMAHARAIVSCAVGGIPEMVEHEKTGLLVEAENVTQLANAIERMIDKKAMRLEFGHAARKRAQASFSLKTHINHLVAQYRDLLQHTDKWFMN